MNQEKRRDFFDEGPKVVPPRCSECGARGYDFEQCPCNPEISLEDLRATLDNAWVPEWPPGIIQR